MKTPTDQNSDLTPAGADELGRDLRRVYANRVEVPVELDDAMRKKIADRWGASKAGTLGWRRGLAWSGIAAALIVGVIWMNWPQAGRLKAPGIASTRYETADVDGNGRIDILDAYQLARRLETEAATAATHDLNRDGAVDGLDVDAIAAMAVRLEGSPG